MELSTVFLSFSGSDEAFVRRIENLLPDGLAYFYPRSVGHGEDILAWMEERVSSTTLYALFASKASLASLWVGFELDKARIAKIKNPRVQILVFIIDRDVSPSDLPLWMREFWVGNVGFGLRDVARFIRRSLVSSLLNGRPENQIFGRGALTDWARGQVALAVATTQATPNIYVLAGNTGIGRRTFARRFLAEAFPASPHLAFGPDFILPQFADLADMYRALRQELENGLSVTAMGTDVESFSKAPIQDQAKEVTGRLGYFADLGQAVTLVTGNGIYEDRGYLKAWVPELFRQIASEPKIRLVIVTNRLLHENELRPHTNVFQMQVPAIAEPDVRTLMLVTMGSFGSKPELPSDSIIRSIGGHPGIARATAVIVGKKGPAVIDSDPSDLFSLQEDVLGESLNFANLSDVEKDVLSILSWVPQLEGNILKRIILLRNSADQKSFAESVSNLGLACLVETSGANYTISSPVRALFRRLHGYGSAELRKAFSAELRAEWERAKQSHELRAELLDAIAYMAAIEGGTLPKEFANLLLPSTLQEVVRETYDRSHDDQAGLARVVAWGLPATGMFMDETTREEILSYVVRAQTRLGDTKGTEATLDFFDTRRYRSRFYLRAFYERLHNGDLKTAISLLLEARQVRKYMGRVIGELAACYQRLGMWRELQQLVQEEDRYIGRNAVLLNVRIGMYIAQNAFDLAQKDIRVLEKLPRQQAMVDARTAMILMRKDQDFSGAQQLLTRRLQQGTSLLTVRRLRAIAAAFAGDVVTARGDADFLKARLRNYTGHDIEARIKLTQKDYDGAIHEIKAGGTGGFQDELLMARILDAKSQDILTPFGQREELQREASRLRSRHRMLDEYEVDLE